ncbi:MAG: helix-turn-helix domain-containing protein [Barnesiella sp.]
MKYFLVCSFICFLSSIFQSPLSAKENKDDDSLSFYTEPYIMSIYISEPERALSLLNKAEALGTMSLSTINDLRSMSYRTLYMNKISYEYARKSYISDSISNNNPQHLLKMIVSLSELSYLLSEYEESLRYASQGIELAQKTGDRKAEGKLLFSIGENKRILSLKKEGYQYINQAIELLQKTQDIEEMAMLSYFYGVKMGYLIDDSEYEEALSIGTNRKKLIDKIHSLSNIPVGYTDQQYAYTYSKMAYAAFMTQQYSQAEKYFDQYRKTKMASTPDGKYDATPYLLITKRFQEVLDNCEDFKKVLRQQDTINHQYTGVLQKEIMAYSGLKNYEKVAELQKTLIEINENINEREKKNAALELNTIYETNKKEALIAEQSSQLKIRNISLISILCISFLLIFLLWKAQKYARTIKYKNKALSQYIDEQLINQKTIRTAHERLSLLSPSYTQINSDNINDTEEQEQTVNKQIFQELDRIITREKLYLSSDLSREELARKVRLNHTRFARMIKENTGTNLNGYLNNLRLNHAIQLLIDHPEYTLKAIAEESGINSMPTFHNLFKQKTGMTPAEFKNTRKKL